MANENLPGRAVNALRSRAHDVLWIRTDRPGATDDEVLRLAQADERLLITFDKDFGELAFRRGLPAQCGVVLLRLSLPDPDTVAQRVVQVLESRADWSGVFAVIEDDRIRTRPLPPTQ